MERHIVHLDLDSFFVSVERLHNKALTGKPIIIGGTSDRGVVSSCSYEARSFGVSSGMPMKTALRLCGDAMVIRGDMDLYTKHSREVTDIIAEKSPLFEKASIDEHYIDISGMDKFFGCLKWSKELRQTIIKNTGLPISFGLSINKTVSKIATSESKPNGELFVPQEQVIPFLSPLSISKIPMIGDKTFRLLREMGITSIESLRNVPMELMQKVMGKSGIAIWKKANGIDPTPVQPYHERQSIGSETTFENDTIDVIYIKRLIAVMVEKLTFQLRKKKKLTSCITIKIRYSNFDTHTMQRKIQYTSFDHIITPFAVELFEKLYQRRMLIRLVGVKLSGLVNGVQQLDMFSDTSEMTNLYSALDNIRLKYGIKSIQRGNGMILNIDHGKL